jgi:TPR repeat protein
VVWIVTLRQLLANEPVCATLAEAVATFEGILQGNEILLAIIQEKRNNIRVKLRESGDLDYSEEFALAIWVYSLEQPNVYGLVNGVCHAENRKEGPGGVSVEMRKCLPYIKFLDTALANLSDKHKFTGELPWSLFPDFDGSVKRGVKWVYPSPNDHRPATHFPFGKEIYFYEFRSASRKAAIMSRDNFCGHDESTPRTIFTIKATEVYSIAHLSDYPDEAECLFRPLSKFRVILATQNCDPTLQIDATGGFPDSVILEQVPSAAAGVQPPAAPPAPALAAPPAPAPAAVQDVTMQLQGMGFSDEQIGEGCKHGDTAEEVVEWITAHAEMEKARKDYAEGVRCYGGYGQDVDDTSAADCYRRAAEARYAPAAYALGRCYCKGQGVEKDEAEGLKWCSKAVNEMGLKELAEQGDTAAQSSLGRAYMTGNGVAEDEAEGVRWIRKAADLGLAEAQCGLGFAYKYGDGVAKDEAEGVRWLRKAADQGHAQAQFVLGSAYMNGDGVAKDEAEGARWIRKAADQGNALAQKALRDLQGPGAGVQKKKGIGRFFGF